MRIEPPEFTKSVKHCGADYYASLREHGILWLNPEEVNLIPALRRHAKKEGLRVQQNKGKGSMITTVYLLEADTPTIHREPAKEPS